MPPRSLKPEASSCRLLSLPATGTRRPCREPVLTTSVNNGVYGEPLYGENNRPDKIPQTLCHTDWWYRTVFSIPAAYAGKKIWLNFNGINYAAEVWVNSNRVGTIKGAFIRGHFDVNHGPP